MSSQDNREPTSTGFPLVALAAALWGTDALFRRGLALELPATTVVVWEHLLLALVLAPVLVRVPWRRLTTADVACLIFIGIGASALATIMFTAAFRYGDPNTPLLLQKLQPFVAVIAARVILRERPTPRFVWFFLAALTSAWLITFANPLQVSVAAGAPAALAAGAAALWAFGTVLGRRMTTRLSFAQLTASRFAIGLPAATIFATIQAGDPSGLRVHSDSLLALVLLALVPGLLAMLLYYRGLRGTTASAATIAELGFPLTALTTNAIVFDAVLTPTQWVGVLGLSAVVVAMSMHSRQPLILAPVPHGSPSHHEEPARAGVLS